MKAEAPIKTQKGRLVNFEVYSNRLVIRLTDQGKDETSEWTEEGSRGDLGAFFDLCEDQLCNGWCEVKPEQVGDLRDNAHLTFTEDFTFPDENSDDVMIVGTAYHFDRYAIDGYMETISREGFVTFDRHDYLTPAQFEAEVERLEKAGVDTGFRSVNG